MPTILETDIGEIELPDSWSPEQIQDYAHNQLPTLREGLKKGATADLASRVPRDLSVAGGGVIQGLARLPYSIFGPRSETSVRSNFQRLGLQAALAAPLGEEKAIIEGADEAANRAELNAMKLAQARESQLAKDPVYKFGGESNQAAREFYATNPMLDDSVLAKGSAAVTSTIPVIAAAPAGPIAMAAVYGAMSGQQGAEEAIERGRPDLADEAYLAYAGLGALSEAALGYPMALIRGIRAARRAGVPPAAFGEMAKRSFPQLVGQVAKESGKAAIREAVQESTEQFGQNVAAREIGFDPNRELSQGVGEAALYGGAVGGLFGGGFGAAQAIDARPRSQADVIDRLLKENQLDTRPIDPQLADIQARESMRPENAQRTVVPAMLQPTPPVADYFLDDVEQTPVAPPRRRSITPAPESPRYRPPPVTPNVAPEQETPVSRPPTAPPIAPPLAPSPPQPTPPVQTPPVPPLIGVPYTDPITGEKKEGIASAPSEDVQLMENLRNLTTEFNGKRTKKSRKAEIIKDAQGIRNDLSKRGYSPEIIKDIELGVAPLPLPAKKGSEPVTPEVPNAVQIAETTPLPSQVQTEASQQVGAQIRPIETPQVAGQVTPPAKPAKISLPVNTPIARIDDYEFGLVKGLLPERPDTYGVGIRLVGSTGPFERSGYPHRTTKEAAIRGWIEREAQRNEEIQTDNEFVRSTFDEELSGIRKKNEAREAEENKKREAERKLAELRQKYDSEVEAVELPKGVKKSVKTTSNKTAGDESEAVSVPMTVHGNLAIRKNESSSAKNGYKYFITHVPSGLSLGNALKIETLAQAKKLVKAIIHTGVDLSKTEFTNDETRLLLEARNAVFENTPPNWWSQKQEVVQTVETQLEPTAKFSVTLTESTGPAVGLQDVLDAFPAEQGFVVQPRGITWSDGEQSQGFLIRLPNGQAILIDPSRDRIAFDPEKAAADWGLDPQLVAERGRARGMFAPNGVGIQGLSNVGLIALINTAGPDTLSHEKFHALFEMALTQQDRESILNRYKTEEKAAEAFRRSEGFTRGFWDKMRQFIERLANLFRGDAFAKLRAPLSPTLVSEPQSATPKYSIEEVFKDRKSLDEFISKPTISQEEAQSLRRQAGARAALVPDQIADEIRALDSTDRVEKRMAGLLEFVLRIHGLAPALEIQRILVDTNLSDDKKDAAISAVLRAIEHIRIKTSEIDGWLQEAMAKLARVTKTMGKVTGERLIEAKAKETVERLIIGYQAYLTAQAAGLPADQNIAAARQQVIRALESRLADAMTTPDAVMRSLQAIALRIDELPVALGPAAVIEAIRSKGILKGVVGDSTIDLLLDEKPGGLAPLLLNPQTNNLLRQLADLQKKADVYAKQIEVFEQAFRGTGDVTPVELKKWAETYRKFRNKQAEATKAIAEMDKAFREADDNVQAHARAKDILERLQADPAFRAQFQAVIDIPGGSIFKDIVDTPGDTRIKEYTSPLAQEDADGNVVYRKYRVLLAPDRQADEQTMREMALLVGEIDEFLAGDVTPIERRTWTQLRDYIRKYQLIPMFATTVPGWSFETGAGIIELNPWAMVQVLAGGRARAPRSEMEKMTLRAADMANTAFRVGDQSLNGYRLIRNNREYGDEVSKIAVLNAVKSHKHEVTGEPWDYTRIEHWNEWVLNPIIASGQTPGQMRLGVGDFIPGTGIKITKEDMAAARLQKRFSQAVVQTTQGTAKNLPPLLRDNPILVEDEFAGRPTKRRAFGTGPLTMARRFSQWARVFTHLWTTATPDGRRRLLADDRNFRLAALGYVTTTNPEYQTSSPLKPVYEEYTARARTDEDQQVQSFDQLVDRLAEIAVSKGIFPDMATAQPQIEATLLQEIDQVVKAFATQIAQQGHEGDTPQAIVATASSRNAFTTARQQMVAPDTFYDYTLTSANDRIAFVAGGYQMFQEKQVSALKDLQTALKLELDKLEQQIVTLTPKVGQKRAYSEVQKQTAKEQELGERRFTYMRLQQHKRTIDKLVDDLSKMVIDVRDPNDAAALLALSRFQSTLSSGLLASPMAMANNYFGGGVAASYLTMLNLGRARMLLPVKALGNLVSVLPRRLLASYPSRTFIGKFARSHIKVVRQMARLIEETIANEIYFHTEAEAWGLRSPPDMRNRLKAAKELKGTAGQIIYGKPELLKSIPNWMESIPGFRQFFTLLRDLSPRFIDEQVNAATARTFQSEAFGWLKVAAVKAFKAREELAKKTGANIGDFTQRSNLLTPEELGLHKSHGFRDLTRLRQLFQTVGTLDGHLLDYYRRYEAAPEGEKAAVPFFTDPAAEGSVLFDMEAHGNIPTTGFTPPAMAGVGQNGVIKRLIFMFQNYVLRTGAQLERLPEKDLRDPKGWREAYGFWAVFAALMAFLLSGLLATETGVPLTKAITGRAPSRVTAANVLADPDAAILARYAGMALGNNFPYYGKVISEMLGNPGYGSAWDAANLIPVAGLIRDANTMVKRMGQTGDPVFPALDFLGRWMPPVSPAIRLMPGMEGDIQAKNAARALRVVGPSEGMELAGGGGGQSAQTPVTPEIRRLLAAAYQGDADGIRRAFDAAVSAKQATGSPDPVRAVKQSLAAAIPARRVYGRSITAAEEQGLIGRMTDSQKADYSGAQQAFSLINQTLGTNYRLTSAPPKLKTTGRRRRQLRGRASRLPSIKRSRASRRSPFRRSRRLAGRRRRRNPSFSMSA